MSVHIGVATEARQTVDVCCAVATCDLDAFENRNLGSVFAVTGKVA